MKNIYVFSLLAMLFSFTSCWDSDYQEDFDELKAKATGAGSSNACPVGKWGTPTCSSGSGKKLVFYFGSDGKGYSENPECSGACTPMKFNFNYSVSGDKITYNFTSADKVTCNNGNSGTPATPTGTHSITFTCLNGGSQLQTEAVNIQTGARTVMTFDRM